MMLALLTILLASLVMAVAVALIFPLLRLRWKLTIFAALILGGCSILIGLYYYGAYWTPPDAVILQPKDVYPGKLMH